MIVNLPRPFAGPGGTPVVDRVDTLIFAGSYFDACMRCDFCDDGCCSYGVDVDFQNVARMGEIRAALEAETGIREEEWYQPGFYRADCDGEYRHFRVAGDRCVFSDRKTRGCRLHRFCLERGLDYHRYKPLICWLFPLTYDEGLLHPSIEIFERSLACQDKGASTYYRGVRGEILHGFGPELVEILDRLEAETLSQRGPDK